VPRLSEKRHVPHPPERLYTIVADVARYPDFLPWCLAARVYDETERGFMADLRVGNRLFQGGFTSRVIVDPSVALFIEGGGSSLKRLRGSWRFFPARDGGCDVAFDVDFRLASGLLGAMMEGFFTTAFQKITQAFEERAEITKTETRFLPDRQ